MDSVTKEKVNELKLHLMISEAKLLNQFKKKRIRKRNYS